MLSLQIKMREQDPAFLHKVSGTLMPNMPEDRKINNIWQLESSLHAVRLKEFILLGAAKGQCRGNGVGVRGDICFVGWLENNGIILVGKDRKDH